MRYLRWIVPLTLLYVALTANAEVRSWLLGMILAMGITALMRPNPAPIQWGNVATALLASIQFLVTLLRDLLVSSLQVTRLVLQRDIALRQGIFALKSGSDSSLVTLLSAHAITLTPGELVLKIDEEGTLYTHSLDVVNAAEKEPLSQQRRVLQLEKIF